jgi:hypothetical protein
MPKHRDTLNIYIKLLYDFYMKSGNVGGISGALGIGQSVPPSDAALRLADDCLNSFIIKYDNIKCYKEGCEDTCDDALARYLIICQDS